MKKLILLALTAVIMAGCERINSKPLTTELPLKGYRLQIVDSCEYLCRNNRMAHKGNCRFCAERRKQELKKLVEQLKGE